jgi:hypothetical protein
MWVNYLWVTIVQITSQYFIFPIVQNHIEENKTFNSSKFEHIFYTTKIFLLKI